jgi:hypothetical protein
MLKNFARVLAAAAFLLAAVLPSTASAAGGGGTPGAISLSFEGTAIVTDRLLITATVTSTCLLLQYPDGPPVTDTSGYVSFSQVRGNTISHASGQGIVTVCDGLPHSSQITAVAYDHPFHSGGGAAQAQVFQLCGYDPVYQTYLCTSGFTSEAIDFVAVH